MNLLMSSIGYIASHPLAIVLCMVANTVVGMIWYGPLFGKIWMAGNGMKMPEKGSVKFSDMLEPLITSWIGAAIMGAVLASLFAVLQPQGLVEAKMIATTIWLAFIASNILSNYAWSARPMSLRLVDVFYPLVLINIFAAILLYVG